MVQRLLILCSLLVLVMACIDDQDEDDLSPTAGTITVYSVFTEDQTEAYLRVFQERYPDIEVQYELGSSAGFLNQVIAERTDPQSDVLWGLTTTSILILEWRDALQPYAPHGLENVNIRFRDTGSPPNWVGLHAWLIGLCVNREALEANGLPIPETWDDLLAPDYQGQITMPNPNTSGTGYMIVSSLLQHRGSLSGWRYLETLHDNIGTYTSSGYAPCREVAAGNYWIGISDGAFAATTEAQTEGNIAVFPDDGIGWDMATIALTRRATIKPAAQTFFDWAISQEAIGLYAQSAPITAVKTSILIPRQYPLNLTSLLLDLDFPSMAANNSSITTEWAERFSDKFPTPTPVPDDESDES